MASPRKTVVIIRAGHDVLKFVIGGDAPEILGDFLIDNGESNARSRLRTFITENNIADRPAWTHEKINQELQIVIPSLKLNYVLLPDVPEQDGQLRSEPQEEQPWTESQQSQLLAFANEELQLEGAAAMEALPQQKNQGNRWNHSTTLKLIEEWSQRRARFSNNIKTNEDLWEEVATKLSSESLLFSGAQCDNRFKYIINRYYDTKDYNSKKTTREPEKTCPYYKEFDEIFKKSPKACPTAASSKDNLVPPKDLPNTTMNTPQATTSHQQESQPASSSGLQNSSVPQKRTRLEISLKRWVEDFRRQAQEQEQARQRRHDDYMQLQRENNILFREIITKLLDKL